MHTVHLSFEYPQRYVSPPAVIKMVFNIKRYVKAKPIHLDMSMVGVPQCDYSAQGLSSNSVLPALLIPTVCVSSCRLLTSLTLLCVSYGRALSLSFQNFLFRTRSQSSLPFYFLSTHPSMKI